MTATPWTTVRVTPSEIERRDAVGSAMFACGAGGLQEIEASLVTHVDASVDVEELEREVLRADPSAIVTRAPTEVVDWSERWRSHLSAHRVGPLTIAPPWLADGRDLATTIIIDPGMAFGTGEHPTTRGCVRLMAGVVAAGDRVADLGAGSGILSIAAAKLGAGAIYAIEIDSEAMGNAAANLERNAVTDRVSLFDGDAAILLPLLAPVRLVIANIISSVLRDLMPVIEEAVGSDGRVILSGILVEERTAMHDHLRARGWEIDAEDVEDQWWSVRLTRGRTP